MEEAMGMITVGLVLVVVGCILGTASIVLHVICRRHMKTGAYLPGLMFLAGTGYSMTAIIFAVLAGLDRWPAMLFPVAIAFVASTYWYGKLALLLTSPAVIEHNKDYARDAQKGAELS